MMSDLFLISRRKFIVVDERFEDGVLVMTIQWLESEEAWLQRCAILRNVGEVDL